MSRFTSRWLFVLLLGYAAVAAAQQSDGCRNRTIIVDVRDRHGEMIAGLGPASFRGKFHDQPIVIRSSNLQSGLGRMVLVLDLSGSMAESTGGGDLARTVAGKVLSTVPPNSHQLAMVTFASQILDTLDFSSSPAQITQRLANLTVPGSGKTALYDALLHAVELLKSPQPGDTIFAITDGGDNASHSHYDDLKKALFSIGIRFSAFQIDHSAFEMTREEASGEDLLRELVNTTGGFVASVEYSPITRSYALTQLEPRWQAEYDRLKNFYLLEIELPVAVDKPRGLELDVIDEKGHVRKDVNLTYPRKLGPCAVQP